MSTPIIMNINTSKATQHDEFKKEYDYLSSLDNQTFLNEFYNVTGNFMELLFSKPHLRPTSENYVQEVLTHMIENGYEVYWNIGTKRNLSRNMEGIIIYFYHVNTTLKELL